MINLMLSFIVLLSLSHTKLHQCVQCRCCCCNIFEAVLSIVLLSLFHTKLHQCAFVIVVVLAIDLKRMFALSNFTLTLSHWAATACVVVVTTDLKLMSALIYSSLSLSLNYVSMCALYLCTYFVDFACTVWEHLRLCFCIERSAALAWEREEGIEFAHIDSMSYFTLFALCLMNAFISGQRSWRSVYSVSYAETDWT